MGPGGDGGGQAASSAWEATAEARAALTAGAGSVGDCNGNPARCAAVNLAAGYAHTVALKSDGTVWAWGGNGFGQLGNGSTTNSSTPVQVSMLSGVTTVAAGDFHTVALKSDGTVWAWGFNDHGQLGDSTTTERHAPVPVSGLGGVTAVAAGPNDTVALKSDGTVWAWGWNGLGELGDSTTTERHTPVPVSGLSLLSACDSALAACNAGTGTCVAPPAANGTACNDGDVLTPIDTCQNGVCTGSTSLACTGGTDANGTALGPVAPNTTVCGGGNKTWFCDAAGQWQYGGADCTVGNVPQTPSCTCSGGYDANGTTLGLVACNSTVCGGGYVSYLCDASGHWQNLTTSCSLP